MKSHDDKLRETAIYLLKKVYCVLNRVVYIVLIIGFVILPAILVYLSFYIFLIFAFAHQLEEYEQNGTTVRYKRAISLVAFRDEVCTNYNSSNETCTTTETTLRKCFLHINTPYYTL